MMVAFDAPPFTMLQVMEPRPPRLLFFIFRLMEICVVGVFFSANIKHKRARHDGVNDGVGAHDRCSHYMTGGFELDDSATFDVIFVAAVGVLVALYCLCLVIPYGTNEPMSHNAHRSITLGAGEWACLLDNEICTRPSL
jgi:hypothetical protein